MVVMCRAAVRSSALGLYLLSGPLCVPKPKSDNSDRLWVFFVLRGAKAFH